MTSQLQKQFYNTFGIKQRDYTQCTSMGCKYVYKNCNNCQFYNVYKVDYPQITDRILLHLLCILNNYGDTISSNNIKKLEDEILIKTITLSKDIDITPQVRALFSNK